MGMTLKGGQGYFEFFACIEAIGGIWRNAKNYGFI